LLSSASVLPLRLSSAVARPRHHHFGRGCFMGDVVTQVFRPLKPLRTRAANCRATARTWPKRAQSSTTAIFGRAFSNCGELRRLADGVESQARLGDPFADQPRYQLRITGWRTSPLRVKPRHSTVPMTTCRASRVHGFGEHHYRPALCRCYRPKLDQGPA
jgi:hypothetical protein